MCSTHGKKYCSFPLTKLHLSMSKSWLAPDYFFYKMLTLARLKLKWCFVTYRCVDNAINGAFFNAMNNKNKMCRDCCWQSRHLIYINCNSAELLHNNFLSVLDHDAVVVVAHWLAHEVVALVDGVLELPKSNLSFQDVIFLDKMG